jgi:hypothetical protein
LPCCSPRRGECLSGHHEQAAALAADPLLVDYREDGQGDYRLTATSPAIDSGTTLGAPEYDFALSPRPLGGGIDVGAYASR